MLQHQTLGGMNKTEFDPLDSADPFAIVGATGDYDIGAGELSSSAPVGNGFGCEWLFFNSISLTEY